MLPTLVGGGIALIIAIFFLGTILIKIPSIALWIVVLIGIALMVVSVSRRSAAARTSSAIPNR